MHHRQINKFTPEVFSSPTIQKSGLVYAETRYNTPDSLLSGNLDIFHTRLVENKKNHLRSESNLSYTNWVESLHENTVQLNTALHRKLGLQAIGHPLPMHEGSLVNLDEEMPLCLIDSPYLTRPQADVAFVSKPGYASCFAPADCPISNIIDTRSGNQLQIHTGYIGLEKEVIGKSFSSLRYVINPETSVVYVSPHAQDGFVINQTNNVLFERFVQNPNMAEYVTISAEGIATLSMTKAVKAQLVEAGIREENIQISPDNTLTDPTLFSQSRFLTKGVNGRNGMVFGKTLG